MYLVCECLCGKTIHLPVEQGKVISTACEHCGSGHDTGIYKNSYRVNDICVHHELVVAGVSEQIDECNPIFCGKKG